MGKGCPCCGRFKPTGNARCEACKDCRSEAMIGKGLVWVRCPRCPRNQLAGRPRRSK